jgi:cyclase
MTRRVRVIPVVLLADQGMVKTRGFARPIYLGDPVNALKIFNDKGVDELVLLDIQATAKARIDFDWVENIVSEAFMPVAYGGGIRSSEDCAELFRRGVEKVVINTVAGLRPELITEIAQRYGSQSVVVSMDVKRNVWRQFKAYIRNGRKSLNDSPVDLARKYEALGAGELLLTSIAREGSYDGYDIELLQSISTAVNIPVIANGGAGQLADFEAAITSGKCSGVAAGSMFVFAAKGDGVLINFPTELELQEQLWSRLV